jgi:hypothetical protein
MDLARNVQDLRIWWNSLPEDWKSFFKFNYLIKNSQDLLIERCERYTESVGSDLNSKTVYQATDLTRIIEEYEIPSVIHFTVENEQIFNYDYKFCFATKEGEWIRQTLLGFSFKDLEPLRYLNKLRTIYFGDNLQSLDIDLIKGLHSIRQIDLDFKHHKNLSELIKTFPELDEVNVFVDFALTFTDLELLNFENSLPLFKSKYPKIDFEMFIYDRSDLSFDLSNRSRICDLVGTYFYEEKDLRLSDKQ